MNISLARRDPETLHGVEGVASRDSFRFSELALGSRSPRKVRMSQAIIAFGEHILDENEGMTKIPRYPQRR